MKPSKTLNTQTMKNFLLGVMQKNVTSKRSRPFGARIAIVALSLVGLLGMSSAQAQTLSIDKASSASGGPVIPGQTITYTIEVTNDAAASDAATNIVVNDVLPAGVSYVSNTTVATGPAVTGTSSDSITDDFLTNNFSGGTGWATSSWATTGSPSAATGEVFFNGGSDRTITRTVDL